MVIDRTEADAPVRFDAASLLELWETHARRGHLRAGLAAIAMASRGDAADPRSLSLGERNALLLAMRRAQLGDWLDLVAACPRCGTEVEATVSCGDLIVAATRAGTPRGRSWELDTAGYRLRLQAIRVDDELRADDADAPAAARTALISGAVVAAAKGAQSVPLTELPDEVLEAAGESILKHDRLAEIDVGLTCPECGESWPASLDVARLVPEELSQLGAKTLGEIDLLARTYGWTEESILALPAFRRATYVELAGT